MTNCGYRKLLNILGAEEIISMQAHKKLFLRGVVFILCIPCYLLTGVMANINDLIDTNNGAEFERRLREDGARTIQLGADTASTTEHRQGITMPVLCKVAKERRANVLDVCLSYYNEHSHVFLGDQNPLKISNKHSAPGRLLLTPLQWALWHDPSHHNINCRTRWLNGVALFIKHDCVLNPNDLILFAQADLASEPPTDDARAFIELIGNYGVQKVLSCAEGSIDFMMNLLKLCKPEFYQQAIASWQADIKKEALKNIESNLRGHAEQQIEKAEYIKRTAPYNQMLRCVYSYEEDKPLWNIPGIRDEQIWSEIPWSFSNDGEGSTKAFKALKVLLEWAGTNQKEYFGTYFNWSYIDQKNARTEPQQPILPFHYAMRTGQGFLVSVFLHNLSASAIVELEDDNNALHHGVRAHQLTCIRTLVEVMTNKVSGIDTFCKEWIDKPNAMNLSPLDLIQQDFFITEQPNEAVSEIRNYLLSIKDQNMEGNMRREIDVILHSADNRKEFYQAFQSYMNRMLLAHQILSTGLVTRTDDKSLIEHGIKLAGENITLPGVALGAKILNKFIGSYRQARANNTTNALVADFISPTETSASVEDLARSLTKTFKEPLSKLKNASVSTFAQELVIRILVYWADYEPTQGMDPTTNILLYLSTAKSGWTESFYKIKECMPLAFREYLLQETLLSIITPEEKISTEQFLMGIGIEETINNDTVKKYVRESGVEPRYGYRIGTRDEAMRLAFSDINQPSGEGYKNPLVPTENNTVVTNALAAASETALSTIVDILSSSEDRKKIKKTVNNISKQLGDTATTIISFIDPSNLGEQVLSTGETLREGMVATGASNDLVITTEIEKTLNGDQGCIGSCSPKCSIM
jgi:hypothetical protein